MDPRLSWFAMGAVFGLVLCGWPWHPRFSRYSCRRITTCGGGEITRAEWEAMRTPPQFPPGRIIGPDGTTIGYRSINCPDPSPDRRPSNPFNGERIPTRAMTFPPLSEQHCGNCRYHLATRTHSDLCRRNPPQIGPRGEQWPTVEPDDWCGEWVSEQVHP